jgi:hypothetical protein
MGSPPAAEEPGRADALRVVHGDEAALLEDVTSDSVDRGLIGAAEVDPLAEAPHVRVAPVCRDLFAGNEDDRQIRKPFEFLEMGARVVVGDREEIEAEFDRVLDDLLDGVEAVRVECVAVEVTLEPAAAAGIRGVVPRCFDRLSTNGKGGFRTSGTSGCFYLLASGSLFLLDGHGNVISNTVGVDAVDAEEDVPLAGEEIAADVAGGRFVRSEKELGPRGAAPAAEAGRLREIVPARVEDPDIDDVARAVAEGGSYGIGVSI